MTNIFVHARRQSHWRLKSVKTRHLTLANPLGGTRPNQLGSGGGGGAMLAPSGVQGKARESFENWAFSDLKNPKLLPFNNETLPRYKSKDWVMYRCWIMVHKHPPPGLTLTDSAVCAVQTFEHSNTSLDSSFTRGSKSLIFCISGFFFPKVPEVQSLYQPVAAIFSFAVAARARLIYDFKNFHFLAHAEEKKLFIIRPGVDRDQVDLPSCSASRSG